MVGVDRLWGTGMRVNHFGHYRCADAYWVQERFTSYDSVPIKTCASQKQGRSTDRTRAQHKDLGTDCNFVRAWMSTARIKGLAFDLRCFPVFLYNSPGPSSRHQGCAGVQRCG